MRINIFYLIIFFCSIFCSGSIVGGQKKFISIGTASISGVYYPVGAALCRIINKTDKDIMCSVQATPGSVYNINALRNGDVDIGITQADSEYNAYNALGIFKKNKPVKNLRTLFLIHHDVFTIVTRKDTGIRTLDDIKNKRVNIGSLGTGVRDTMQELMKIKHWSKRDFKLASELKSSEQAQALCDNKIDVMIDVVGHPSASIQEASATCDTVIIPIDRKTITELKEKYPYYDDYTIPKDLYIGTDYDVDTFAVRTSILSTEDVDKGIIYNVVKAIFEKFRQFKNVHSLLRLLSKKDMVGKNTAPFHEGAIEYYKKAGLL
ncbi:MAG: TAXI family TRAP transporter solute-binding subunit [Rickettsiaceae bacterium H1]|nr:TAXI family TRAP transporter solute-binding subunit [Rickettsiaceae bacterium H1]